MAGIIIMFIGTETEAPMRRTLTTKGTELDGVGGVVPGSPPSALRPFLSPSHLARTPKLLVRVGHETNSRVRCFRA